MSGVDIILKYKHIILILQISVEIIKIKNIKFILLLNVLTHLNLNKNFYTRVLFKKKNIKNKIIIFYKHFNKFYNLRVYNILVYI